MYVNFQLEMYFTIHTLRCSDVGDAKYLKEMVEHSFC